MKKIFVLGVLMLSFVAVSAYGGEIIRLTNNNLIDMYPIVNEQGKVWWTQQRDSGDYLMYYNGTKVIEISAFLEGSTSWRYKDIRSLIDGNSVVYVKEEKGGAEIYLFDGTKEIQITDNNYNDFYPYICNGYIVWVGQPPDVSGDPNEIFLYRPEPTVVSMSSIKATPSDGQVTVKWKTESEINNAGFNVWRAEFEKINNSLIPAKGSPTQGESYQFIDKNVQNRNNYLYKLEDIDLSGKSMFHDPVSAIPRGIYGRGR